MKNINEDDRVQRWAKSLNQSYIILNTTIACFVYNMDRQDGELGKILQKIAENLVQGNFYLLVKIAKQLNPRISSPILAITKLFQQTMQQSQQLQKDVFFYRDFIKSMIKGQTTEDLIQNHYDIIEVKKQQALNLLKKFKETEKSRMEMEIQLQQKSKQFESIKAESRIKASKADKEFSEKESKMSQQLFDYEMEIMTLKNQLQNQSQIMKANVDSQNQQLEIIKVKQKEKIDLQKKLKIVEQKEEKLKAQLFQAKRDLQKSKFLQSQSTVDSQILIEKLKEKQQSVKSMQSEYKSIISLRQKQNTTLKEEIDELRNHLQSSRESKFAMRTSNKQLFIDQNSIIQRLNANQRMADSFHQTLMTKIGKVVSMSSLYNFSLHKKEIFHKKLDGKRNILLLCWTKEKRIIGGFSSFGFTIKGQEHNGKAFLFSSYEDQIKTFELKKGKKSTIYDPDYLIFGNEELCIEKRSDHLTSYFVNAPKNSLHYHYNSLQDRLTFLSIGDRGANSIQLQNFEVIELVIEND